MLTKKLNENDNFWYVLPRFYEEKGCKHLSFYVMQYVYNEKYHENFNNECMFDDKQKAEEYAEKLNQQSGY